MLKEINIFGVYVAPFAVFFLLAIFAFLPLRWLFDALRIQRWVWHRPLFELAVFIILITLIAFLWTHYGRLIS